MDHARDQLLAGAGLTADVHRCLAAGDAPDHLAQLLHDRRAAEQSRRRQCRRGVPSATRGKLDRAADELAQHAEVERLGYEIEGAELQCAHRRLDIAVCRDHRHRHVGAVFLDPGHEVEPVPIGQAHVGQAQVEVLVLDELACPGEVGGGAGLQIHPAEREADELEQVGLVVHDQHDRLGGRGAPIRGRGAHRTSHRRGSANTSRNTLPPPARGSYSSVARLLCASSRARKRPSPLPRPPL